MRVPVVVINFTVRCKNVAKSKNLVDCGMIRKLQSPDRSQLKADQMEKWHELVPKTSALAIRPRSPTDFGVID